MNIQERIACGEYKPKTEIPKNPLKPKLLCKRVSELTDAEIASLAKVKREHEQARAEWKEALERYQQEKNVLEEAFYQDLCAEYHIPHNHRFAKKNLLYGMVANRQRQPGRGSQCL